MRYIIFFALLLLGHCGFGQNIRIVDEETKEVLIGASLKVVGTNANFSTDVDGIASISGQSYPFEVLIEYIGYQALTVMISNANFITISLTQSEEASVLDAVTITATKYEQNLAKAPVSIDIISANLVKSINASSADEVLNKVPGVQILDGQANIRGGSGYSYGAGSRVMLLIDDMPALQADAGFPNWNDIPIETLSQIEVVKGAASTLYGSAALNGIINYRTTFATNQAENRFSIAGTYIGDPADEKKKWWKNPTNQKNKWWKDSIRYETNVSFVHKKKYGKMDVVASLFANRLESHNQHTYDKRLRLNTNLRYRFTEKFNIGLSAIVNESAGSSFFIWKNAVTGGFQALPGTVSSRHTRRFYIDPTAQYTDSKNNKHRLLTRINYIDNQNNNNQSNTSTNFYGEYQLQRKFEKQRLTLSTGLVGITGKTQSQILGDTSYVAQSMASYLQLDRSMSDKWELGAGIRYEFNQQLSPKSPLDPTGLKEDGQWIARVSTNYQLAEYTFLRGSLGQGYRFPTLTERFVTTTFGSFSIFSNPSLEPEYGFSLELAAKQGFNIAGFKGFLDVSLFQSEYENMIEFTFVVNPTNVGFQPQNIGNTRIRGGEIGIFGQSMIFGLPINLFGGYTYINPTYKNFEESEIIRNSVSEGVNVLKYRSKHLAKMDAEFDIWKAMNIKSTSSFKGLKTAVSVQYASHVINIDKAFESVPPANTDLFDIGGYRNLNNNGFVLLDARASIKIRKATWSVLANNILNKEYSLRPALIEGPRSYAIRLDYSF